MEPEMKKQRKNYITWSISERHLLVNKRIEKDAWFTGKNANCNDGWKKIAAELKGKIAEDKNNIACKNQWNSLIKKYKSFFIYRTGEGTGEEATVEDPNDWEFYEAIHSYASQKDNFHPPYLLDSSDGVLKTKETFPANKGNLDLDSPSTSKSRSNLKNIERDIKKRDKKISKKISSLLSVFGQMVQTDYPHIDASVLFVSSESDSD